MVKYFFGQITQSSLPPPLPSLLQKMMKAQEEKNAPLKLRVNNESRNVMFLPLCRFRLVTYDVSFNSVVDIHKLFTACLNVGRSEILRHAHEV